MRESRCLGRPSSSAKRSTDGRSKAMALRGAPAVAVEATRTEARDHRPPDASATRERWRERRHRPATAFVPRKCLARLEDARAPDCDTPAAVLGMGVRSTTAALPQPSIPFGTPRRTGLGNGPWFRTRHRRDVSRVVWRAAVSSFDRWSLHSAGARQFTRDCFVPPIQKCLALEDGRQCG